MNTFISTEYARKNKQNKLTAKQFRANAIEKQAEAMEELIAYLTENHTRQMETLIKSTTEAMKEMMQLIKSEAKTPSNTNDSSKEEKQNKHDKKRKKYNEAPICKNCRKKHPSKKGSQMLGIGGKQSFPPKHLEIVKEHLKVHGAHNRNRDVAARESADE
jgi:hypothetical protein